MMTYEAPATGPPVGTVRGGDDPSKLVTLVAVSCHRWVHRGVCRLWELRRHPIDLVLLAVLYVACGLGITVGYHRLFSHKAFTTDARRPRHPRRPGARWRSRAR